MLEALELVNHKTDKQSVGTKVGLGKRHGHRTGSRELMLVSVTHLGWVD
jgi:hypothetical protein